MGTNLLKLTFYFVFVFYCGIAHGTDYYFSSSTGDDRRTAAEAQNPSTPWKSIDKLNEVFKSLQPGDGVYFKRGDTFFGTIKIARSGTSARPITLGAYGMGDKPIVTGLVSLTAWTHVGNGIYESSHEHLERRSKIVLMNDIPQEMGRWPNIDTETKGYIPIESTDGRNRISNNMLSSSNWTGAEVVIRKSHWTIDRHTISSHSGNTVTYHNFTGAYNPVKNYGFFIQNHIRTLDKYGEWYFNPSNKKLSVYFGPNSPSLAEVSVSVLDNLVTNSKNSAYIIFKDLNFKGANKNAFYLTDGHNIQVKNVLVEFSGESGFSVQDLSDMTIEDSHVISSYSNGIHLRNRTPNAKIINNKVENTNLTYGLGENGTGSGYGIEVNSDNSRVEYNEIINTGYIGIRFGGNNTIVKNNIIDRFNLTKDDGAGIYTWTGPSNTDYRGRKIIGNIVLNGEGAKEGTPLQFTTAKAPADGIYLDDNSSGIEIRGNTVGNVNGKGLYIHNARNLVVENNTFFNNSIQLAMVHDHLGNPIRNNSISENIYFSKSSDQLTAYFSSIKNDIQEMGIFDKNYHVRPTNEHEIILTQSKDNSGRTSSNFYDLDQWAKAIGQDQLSNKSPVQIPLFNVEGLDKTNKYPNGSYDTEKMAKSGIHGNGSSLSWVPSGKLDEGALAVTNKATSSFVTMGAGPLKKSAHYVLRFSAIASEDMTIKALLIQSSSPYGNISETVTFKFTPDRNEYEAIFAIDKAESAASIRFITEKNVGTTYWLDNVALYEAEVTPVDPEEYVYFVYNPTRQKKSFQLSGNYVDVKNLPHSESMSLEPFASTVLIKTSSHPNPEKDPIKVAPRVGITAPIDNKVFEGPCDIEIVVEAWAEKEEIEKVEFFSGAKLIATVSSPPYVYTGKDIDVGEYIITAKAYTEHAHALSEPIKVSVQKAYLEKPTPDTQPEEGGFSIYLNTGSNNDITFDGVLFRGDKNFNSYYGSSSEYSNQGASDNALFQTERNGKVLNYAIPVPNGTYTVKTYHNELWWGKFANPGGKGRRVFDISIEGEILKNKFDLFVENQNEQTILTFENIQVKDGKLNLDMTATADRASVAGIAIIATTDKDVDVNPQPEKTGYSIYLNAGSSSDATLDGMLFKGDKNFSSFFGSSSEYSNQGASDNVLFQTERNGKILNYAIPVPNGTYTVKTYHNELWWGKFENPGGKGRRMFDISIEGKLQKSKFDLFVENNNRPTVLTFENITVSDGVLNLDMTASADRASITGIAIVSTTGQDTDNRPEETDYSLRLNTGSSSDATLDGMLFKGDKNFNSFFGSSSEYSNQGASDNVLFQTERNGKILNYAIPVPNGTYTVKTYHNELWWGKFENPGGKGRRMFDISIEGKLQKSKVDLFVENNNRPTVLTFENITVSDGILNLDMAASADRASISGIEILSFSNDIQPNARVADTERGATKIDNGFVEPEINPEIKIYPNPARDVTTISINKDLNLTDILVHDMNGKPMLQLDAKLLKNNNGEYRIPLVNLSKGVYIVSIVGEKVIHKQLRLIVQ